MPCKLVTTMEIQKQIVAAVCNDDVLKLHEADGLTKIAVIERHW